MQSKIRSVLVPWNAFSVFWHLLRLKSIFEGLAVGTPGGPQGQEMS